MSLSTTLFHAELLSNIRSITVSIHLPAPSNARTELTHPTPSQLQVYHDGRTTVLNLPANVKPSGFLSGVISGETKLSYRLPVAPELQPPPPTENYVPWSALSLSSSTKKATLHCRACSLELVNGEKVSSWKDLPSGNWADMMDFWHCHKPETEDTKNGRGGGKYAGLQGGYKTVVGTVLVDLTYFLVAEGDCAGLQVVQTPSKKGHEMLCCSNCKAILGSVDIDGDNSVRGWRLNKWKIKLRFDANGMCEEYSYPMEPFLSAKILAFAEGEGIRRMIISCNNEGGDDGKERARLKLWLFNTDIRYTNSQIHRPIRALKVFYQEVEDERMGQGASLGSGGFEDVRLARDMVVGLKELLEKSTDGLLEELRGFREWKVGTLQRFEPEHRIVGG